MAVIHRLLFPLWLAVAVAGSTATPDVTTPSGPSASPDVTTPSGPSASPDVTTPSGPPASPDVTTPSGPSAFPDVTTPSGPSASPDVTTPSGPSASPDVTTPSGPSASPDVTTPSGPSASPDVTTPSGPSTIAVVTVTTGPTTTPNITTPKGPSTIAVVTVTTGPTTTPNVTTPSGPSTIAVVTVTTGPTTTPNVTTPRGPSTIAVVTATEGPNGTTTEGPNGTTTEGPNGTTTEVPNVTTTEVPNVTTTEVPNVTTTEVPNVTTTEVLSDPCNPNPCGTGITCKPRFNETFTCLCLAGQNYKEEEKRCEDAKVFPGFLKLKLAYNDNMQEKTSPEFQKASLQIIEALDDVFKKTNPDDYVMSTVLDLSPWSTEGQRFSSLRSQKYINADVESIFKLNAEITNENVNASIYDAAKDCDGCVLQGAVFTATDLCNKKPCDEATASCLFSNGSVSCTCLDDYITTNYSSKICIACPSGSKAQDSDCVPCAYGYSGLNCKESWKLVLVILGSVLGGLLLITLIILTAVGCKPAKKSSKKTADTTIENAYVTHSAAKAPLINGGSASSQVSNTSLGVPRIPRATATNSWNRSNNLEMTPSGSQQNLVPGRNPHMYEDVEDLPPQNRAQTNLYAQNRAQPKAYPQNGVKNNPYAPSRAQTNPYAQSRGHVNPYYTHDDGGRLN